MVRTTLLGAPRQALTRWIGFERCGAALSDDNWHVLFCRVRPQTLSQRMHGVLGAGLKA